MNDEQMQSALDEWFEDTDPQPPNAHRTATIVMAHVPQTRQRGRWLPFRLFRPKAETPTATGTADYQPRPTPATNGRTPIVIGRTQFMLSPVKAITVGAIVFAIGSVMFVVQPFQKQSSMPGAEVEAVAPTWVTGNVMPASSCSGSDIVWDGDVGRRRNVECGPQRWISSDPRLTSTVVRRWNDDIYQTDEGAIWVSMSAAYLRNDDGGWACSSSDLVRGIATTGTGTTVEEEMVNGGTTTFDCVGDDGYEGLSAVLVSEMGPGFAEEFVGLIFSGSHPPVPEPPSAE